MTRRPENSRKRQERMIQTAIRDSRLALETGSSLFSPRKPDPALALLSMVDSGMGGEVLGCGRGLVGIYAAQIAEASGLPY